MTPTVEERLATMRRTIDWLEAHPNQATRHVMARNALGDPVLPHEPSAVCFCFLGRLCVEAGVQIERGHHKYTLKVDDLNAWFEPLGVANVDTLTLMNDLTAELDQRIAGLREYVDYIEESLTQ